jgi:hypothetical protein
MPCVELWYLVRPKLITRFWGVLKSKDRYPNEVSKPYLVLSGIARRRANNVLYSTTWDRRNLILPADEVASTTDCCVKTRRHLRRLQLEEKRAKWNDVLYESPAAQLFLSALSRSSIFPKIMVAWRTIRGSRCSQLLRVLSCQASVMSIFHTGTVRLWKLPAVQIFTFTPTHQSTLQQPRGNGCPWSPDHVRHVAIHKAHALILHAVACHLGRENPHFCNNLATVFVSRRKVLMGNPRTSEATWSPSRPLHSYVYVLHLIVTWPATFRCIFFAETCPMELSRFACSFPLFARRVFKPEGVVPLPG